MCIIGRFIGKEPVIGNTPRDIRDINKFTKRARVGRNYRNEKCHEYEHCYYRGSLFFPHSIHLLIIVTGRIDRKAKPVPVSCPLKSHTKPVLRIILID